MFEGLHLHHWTIAVDDTRLVTLTMNRQDSSANAISHAMLEELDRLLERLEIESPAGVIICSAKSSGFAVGADIHEFAQYEKEGTVQANIAYGQRVYQRLARLPCPTVAAIHGACLGGGTELALACDQRVAVQATGTRIGLPEVMLGIHPGWGGTARLPHLIGAPAALQAILTGKPLRVDKARQVGLLDRAVASDQLLETARQLVFKPQARPLSQRARAWWSNTWPTRLVLAPIMRRQTAARVSRKHYPAPFAVINLWRKGGRHVEQRLRREAASVAELAQSHAAQQLVRVFFLQEQLKDQAGDTNHDIQHVHVVGAGVMGGDIAAWCAWQGFDVTLQDQAMSYVQPALDRAGTLFEHKAHGDQALSQASRQRLTADVDGAGTSEADLAIEAISEKSEAKQSLYGQLEPQLPGTALLASNTSSIPPDELASTLQRPGNFVGLHFFNPVAQMPLVEVVRQRQLTSEAEQRAITFCRGLGKLPLAVTGTPGFLVNRLLMPYMLEAVRMHEEGVPGPVLDRAATRFGMPMGPIELADTVGLDVCASVAGVLGPFLGLDIPDGLNARLQAGQRGKKDGQGLYAWQDGKARKPDVPKDYQPPEDVDSRLILAFLNEAVACLHDGVVDSADLLDAGAIFGTGFAPFRGGPIQYIQDTGVTTVRKQLEELATSHGDRFAPRAGWDNPILQADDRHAANQ